MLARVRPHEVPTTGPVNLALHLLTDLEPMAGDLMDDRIALALDLGHLHSRDRSSVRVLTSPTRIEGRTVEHQPVPVHLHYQRPEFDLVRLLLVDPLRVGVHR